MKEALSLYQTLDERFAIWIDNEDGKFYVEDKNVNGGVAYSLAMGTSFPSASAAIEYASRLA